MHVPRCALASALCLFAVATLASADVNPTPIAVPLIGDQGVGSPYPSRITLATRGGPGTLRKVIVVLHAVTHACPEDLAVLLVHTNGSSINKYLLMSHAGGCRPLQGTDLVFQHGGTPIPDTQSATPPYPSQVSAAPSSYGSTPAFPAPAPGGPYETDLTPNTTVIEGTWDLYVVDTGSGNRGVIAGGWSIHYDTTVGESPAELPSFPARLPAGAATTTLGPAAVYPMTFDFNGVPAGVKVFDTFLAVTLSHSFPADVALILQAPSGESVLVMSNAGGSIAISGVTLTFNDQNPNSVPQLGGIPGGSYKPTQYGPPDIATPAPGPAPPYGTTFSTFLGVEVHGVWKLWVFDDFTNDTGKVIDANLAFVTEPPPQLTLLAPTTTKTYTANTPFVHFIARIPNLSASPHSATWRTEIGGGYYASGLMAQTPGSDLVSADIPMKRGTTPIDAVEITSIDTRGQLMTASVEVTLNEFVYTLSEGATGGFFELDETLANPTGTDAPVTISFLPEHSAPIPFTTTVHANEPNQLHVNSLVPGDGVSTIVHSTGSIPLAIERTMSWDKSGYGGSGGTAIEPNTHWLFAEGSQGYFDTYVLLANDGATDANVTVKFLVEGGSPVTLPVVLAAHTRKTIYAGDVAAIVNTSFGIDITADQPITAERSMYFPHSGARVFEGGHESAGATSTNTHWFFAEGATGPFFECFILLSNPSPTNATAHLTYLLPTGDTVPQTITVPANGRTTIDVETVDPKLANAAVSTDGRLGGPRAYQTYVLLANPNPVAAEVLVRFLRAGQPVVTKTYTLLPTSRLNIGPDETTPLLGEGVFSADIQVLNFQPIVVEKALYWNAGGEIWAAGTGTVGIPIPPPE